MQEYPVQDCTYYVKGRGKRRKLEIKRHKNISVPAYVGKMIVNLVVNFFELNLSYWQDWDHSRSGLPQRSAKLLSLLCNILANAGDERMDNFGQNTFVSGIIPRMERFYRLVEKGYAFLQSFNTMTGNLTEKRKMQI